MFLTSALDSRRTFSVSGSISMTKNEGNKIRKKRKRRHMTYGCGCIVNLYRSVIPTAFEQKIHVPMIQNPQGSKQGLKHV